MFRDIPIQYRKKITVCVLLLVLIVFLIKNLLYQMDF